MKARALSSFLLFLVLTAAVLTRPGDSQLGTAPAPAPQIKLRRAPTSRISASFARLPLSFEANHGQTDPQVKFLSRGRGYTLFLTPTEAVLALAKPAGVADVAAGGITAARQVPGRATRAEPAVLRMKLLGAKARPHVEGLEE